MVKWLSILGLGVGFLVYLNNFSPYKADGSLDPLIILGAFSILAVLSFFIIKAFLSLFCKHQTASRWAFVSSFIMIQVMLISSWNFVSFNSILVILFFNLFICWYAIKVL